MWETLQIDHDTNSEIERERWWKDLFIMTPLRTMMEDIGTRVHRPDDFQNCETNTSLILSFFFFFFFFFFCN